MVELLAEGGAFLRELPLQGSGAGDELAGYVFDGALPRREKFHQGGTHSSRGAVVHVQLREPA